MDEQHLVYFNPKEWSSRFGDSFFTVVIDGYEMLDNVRHLVITVKRGSEPERKVLRRYTDFARMRDEGGCMSSNSNHNFPPKGWWWQNNDQGFLEERRKAMELWLQDVLATDSNTLVIRRFLEL